MIGKCGGDANRAVPAHPEVAHIVEEDHASQAVRINGIAEKRTHHDVGPARFVDDRRAKIVVELAKAFQTLYQRTRPEIGSAADNHARRLPASVGIDDADSTPFSVIHGIRLSFSSETRTARLQRTVYR
jgi:hypothetical protein